VERTAGELLLTWNRDADPIKTATKAVLSISDGERHENVEMDMAQLRNGSIVYSPTSTDISFKMEVTGQGNTKSASESVRVLRNRPSALDQNQPPAPQNAQSGVKPAPGVQPAPTDAVQTSAPAEEPAAQEETKPVVALKPFKAEPLAQRLRPASNTDLPEAPAMSAGADTASIPGVNLNAVMQGPAAPRPVAPATAAPVSTSDVKAQSKSGGQIQQATLLYRKDPEYPKIAKQTGAKGQVKLLATIGKDGKVKAVKALSGHPMLQNAAMDAVRQWVYKPTLLNGVPVETETEVLINFLGAR